jgi:hypothetical protein
VVDGVETLTIWPNLFTQEITVHEETARGFEGRPHHFAAAAALNRGALETSLRSWETAGGGTIVSWDSELVTGSCATGSARTPSRAEGAAAVRAVRAGADPLERVSLLR